MMVLTGNMGTTLEREASSSTANLECDVRFARVSDPDGASDLLPRFICEKQATPEELMEMPPPPTLPYKYIGKLSK